MLQQFSTISLIATLVGEFYFLELKYFSLKTHKFTVSNVKSIYMLNKSENYISLSNEMSSGISFIRGRLVV